MSDKVVINIVPMGGGKGRLPDRSMAGGQRAAGVLPAPSREAQAAAQVQSEMTRERVSKPFQPTVAGTIVPAEFQDSKTFRGAVASAVAVGTMSSVSEKAGSGGSVEEYIKRVNPSAGRKANRQEGRVSGRFKEDWMGGLREIVRGDEPRNYSNTTRDYNEYVANGGRLPNIGQTRSASQPFSPELVADISVHGSEKDYRGSGRKSRGFFGFLNLGRVGDVADSGSYKGAGARAGLNGVVTTSGYNRTILSRALERLNMRGVARFASMSSLGAAVGAVQVGAGIARIYSQVELARINREAAVAATAYKRMKEQDVLSDILSRGKDMKSAEVTQQFLQNAQDFAPLVGIMAALAIQSKFPDAGIGLKTLYTLGATAAGASIAATVAAKFASEGPQSAQYLATTVAEHVRSHMVQRPTKENPSITLGTVGAGAVTITGNDLDFDYLDTARKLLNGQTGMMVGRDTVTAAAWAGVTSPFDVIRATANRASEPKIGVGAVNQSTRTAFKAEQETSLPKADNAIFRRLMRMVGLRNSDQILKEKLLYR